MEACKNVVSVSLMLYSSCYLIYQEDDDVSQCPSEYELNLQDNRFLSGNDAIKSKVSKLKEHLRKRYPTNNLGKYFFLGYFLSK